MQQRVASCPLKNIPQNNNLKNAAKKGSKNLKNVPQEECSSEAAEGSAEHGLEFHFDKDEQGAEEEEDGAWKHPEYSTATYLG